MHLTRKKRGTRTYYYAVQNKRVGNKVKCDKQIYLGTAESIADVMSGKQKSKLLKTKSFGDVALLLYIEKLFGLEIIFNDAINKKRKNQVTGKYYLSIILNRILDPKSKAGINEWLKTTVLDWTWKLNTSSQLFWNHLEYLDEEVIKEISSKVADKTFELINDTEYLWDTSNYFTYIKNNNNSELLGKGKSKQGRHEKNLVCHGLLVGKESGIPVKHFPYKYKHDSKVMNDKIKEMTTFLEQYKKNEFTLVFDKGNNSKENMTAIAKYNFIGSLRSEQVTDLLSIPTTKYEHKYLTKKGNEVLVHDAGLHEYYDSEYRIMLSYEKASYKRQKLTFEKSVKDVFEKYDAIKDKGFKKNLTATNALNKILPKKNLKAFKKEIIQKDDLWFVKLSKNDEAIKLYGQSFGKTAIITNKDKLTPIDVVKSYRSLIIVENQFRALHNSFLIPITPIYEWTDQKITAHIFLCFIALVMVRVLEFISKEKGIDIPFQRLLTEAKNIRLGLLMDGKKADYCFEQMTMQEQKLMGLFDLHEYVKV